MKPPRLRRIWPVVLGGSLLCGAFAIAACSGDDPAPAATPDGSTPGADSAPTTPENPNPNPTADGATPSPQDAGPDVIEITDGGDLPPEEDGGITDPDGGFDAGPACETLTPGAFVTSKCSIFSAIPLGGALSSGVYELASVTVLGNKVFCGAGGSFVAYDHRGALEITATSPTTATFEFLDQYRKTGGVVLRPSTSRYDVEVIASGAKLTFTPKACALKPAPAMADFTVGTVQGTGKKTITLRLPYGTNGSANYHFVEK